GQAALREAHEEVALTLDGVRVVGALTPLDIPVSGFRLHPIVAVAPAAPALAPVDCEVARILDVSVDELLDPATLVRLDRERDGVALDVPAFAIAGHEIWGATAMVLGEAISAIRDWSVADGKEKRDARAAAIFGSLVFNDEVQQARLPKAVYHALRRTMTHGDPLDLSAADAVAKAVKEWAVEHGAT